MASAPLALTPAQIEAIGTDLDAIRARVLRDVGERDARYIKRMIRIQRAFAFCGRGLLFAGVFPPAFVLGTICLGVAKILDNMEIGHNVMHGQYEFMRDPALSSARFEWDTACPASQWRHSHNYMHHTYTNIVGKDRDVGYGILRMSEEQTWRPRYLFNIVMATALAFLFEWGVALHDVETDRIEKGEKSWAEALPALKEVWRKSRGQILKDYVLFPLLAGPFFFTVLAGNALANVIRNLWAFMIIFCGHFPQEVAMFREEDTREETQGAWYVRQMLGSANIEGGKIFHVLTGNLSHQIEHHLFPDLPAHRYVEIAPEVRAICERNGLPYNTGRLSRQFASVVGRILKLSLPPRRPAGTELVTGGRPSVA
jgi:NADPH-dependent stearoyl-CoA 9-desaturase